MHVAAGPFGFGMETGHYLHVLLAYMYNVSAGINRSFEPDFGHADLWYEDRIQSLIQEIWGVQLFPNRTNVSEFKWLDFPAVGVGQLHFDERFVTTGPPADNLKGDLKWGAERMGLKYPVLPPCSRRELGMIQGFCRENPGQKTKDIEELCMKFKRNANGVDIFPKIPSQIKPFIKKWKLNQEAKVLQLQLGKSYTDLYNKMRSKTVDLPAPVQKSSKKPKQPKQPSNAVTTLSVMDPPHVPPPSAPGQRQYTLCNVFGTNGSQCMNAPTDAELRKQLRQKTWTPKSKEWLCPWGCGKAVDCGGRNKNACEKYGTNGTHADSRPSEEELQTIRRERARKLKAEKRAAAKKKLNLSALALSVSPIPPTSGLAVTAKAPCWSHQPLERFPSENPPARPETPRPHVAGHVATFVWWAAQALPSQRAQALSDVSTCASLSRHTSGNRAVLPGEGGGRRKVARSGPSLSVPAVGRRTRAVLGRWCGAGGTAGAGDAAPSFPHGEGQGAASEGDSDERGSPSPLGIRGCRWMDRCAGVSPSRRAPRAKGSVVPSGADVPPRRSDAESDSPESDLSAPGEHFERVYASFGRLDDDCQVRRRRNPLASTGRAGSNGRRRPARGFPPWVMPGCGKKDPGVVPHPPGPRRARTESPSGPPVKGRAGGNLRTGRRLQDSKSPRRRRHRPTRDAGRLDVDISGVPLTLSIIGAKDPALERKGAPGREKGRGGRGRSREDQEDRRTFLVSSANEAAAYERSGVGPGESSSASASLTARSAGEDGAAVKSAAAGGRASNGEGRSKMREKRAGG
ncbi:hypothetical protein THAOC_35159 [Thalassiosira oceanica]|uniref:Uncharacterized protein n=1 Tax=Thalassiosira oceanica TaxID=159749 RepID=K0R1C6_THAOC|nr:hypothetical protein THAOC_35159 [Thalassiosira oceanica]|eukprot:EJK46183.1 hypothetical protein THAOC_35159 [Thalassiosira oceanica]